MFYGEKLHDIREMFSYSREDLAKKLQVSEQMIWKFETNQATPDFKLINLLKSIFYVQASYFFQKPYVLDISNTELVAFRKNKSNKREGIKSEKVYLDHLYTHINDIERVVYPNPGPIFSFFQKIESQYILSELSQEDIKNIAEEAREFLGIISNDRLMYFLEMSGIYIIERKLENTIDAYSTWLFNESYPIIVLNSGKNSAVRRNFDMGHELGHLLLHRYVDFDALDIDEMNRIENEANLFASYFNLPEEELYKDFINIEDPTNPDAYIPLKNKYRMSIQSIAYRANKSGWITKEENTRFWNKINQCGYRRFEPLDDTLTIHIPGKIRSLIYHALEVDNNFISNWLVKYSVDIKYFETIFNINDDFLSKHLTKESTRYRNNVVNFNNS